MSTETSNHTGIPEQTNYSALRKLPEYIAKVYRLHKLGQTTVGAYEQES